MDWSNWSSWFIKLKWQLISFKFLSFTAVITLVSLFFIALQEIFQNTVKTVVELKSKDIIQEKEAAQIIIKTLEVLYDSSVSHVMVTTAAVLTGIIAIKGVSYIMTSKQTQEVVKKMENGSLEKNLGKFMPGK